MRDEIMAEASRHGNLRVVFTDAADSSNRQIQDVNTLLASGIDLLIISPNDTEALTPVIARGLPPYSRHPSRPLGRGLRLHPVHRPGQSSDRQAGGSVRLRAARSKRRKDRRDHGPVGIAAGPRQEPGLPGRHFAPRDNITIVDTIVADWLRDKAEDELTAWLKKKGRVDVIFAQNDAMADGARRAAAKLGISGIRVVGIDGLPGPNGGIEMVRRRDLSATFTCPTGGKEAVIYAMDILHHEEGIPKKMILRTSLVTEKTIESGALGAPARPRLPAGSSHRAGFRPDRQGEQLAPGEHRVHQDRGAAGRDRPCLRRLGRAAGKADRRGEVFHRAQSGHHFLFPDRRVRVGARAAGGKSRGDPGFHHPTAPWT